MGDSESTDLISDADDDAIKAFKLSAIKINQDTLPAHSKPTSRSTQKENYKTFKGASNCPKCGSASYMRRVEIIECISCGHVAIAPKN